MKYYTVKKLRQLAKEQGIKRALHMNGETLGKILGISYEKSVAFNTHNRKQVLTPVVILCVDPVTKEKVTEFRSIYGTAKYLKINPRYVYVYIKSEKIVEVFGNKVILVRK